jgi:VWFA-related protein
MSMAGRLGCLFLLALLSPFSASAQQSHSPAQAANGGINLDVVVAPKSGAAESGLRQQDFTLMDNNAAQTITSFKAFTGREASVEVVLIIDAANADYQAVEYARNELDKFLRAEGGRLAFPVTIGVLTDTGIQMLGDFSTDGNALSAQLDQNKFGLRFIRRDAGLQGAAERWELSVNGLQKLADSEAPRPGRKIMIWISPGWPLLAFSSEQLDAKTKQKIFTDLVSITNELVKARVTLSMIDPRGASESVGRADYYKVFLKPVTKSSQVDLANLGLQVFATQSGGFVFTSDNDIAKAVQTCLSDAAPYYEISFVPSSESGANEYHRLEVKVAKPGLTARTRESYYAQP